MDYTELVKRLREQMECDKKLYPQGAPFETLLLDLAADAIEELSKPRWIPVTERLPEKHERVLVHSKRVKMKTDFINNDGKWYTTPLVTHWMPLPEPPKEET